MNYYEHHLGDFLKKTAHLSAMQEGIYRRLLDQYYIREEPLPGDFEKVCRLARVQGRHEKQACRDVLDEFFPLVDGCHTNARAEEEISKYHAKPKKEQSHSDQTKERQRRARERRAALFALLRGANIVPKWDATTTELEALIARHHVTQPVTAHVTATVTALQSPVPSPQLIHTPPDGGESPAVGEAPPGVDLLGHTLNGRAPKTTPDCPHAEILALWAELMPDMPQHAPELWAGSARADHLRARWKATAKLKGWATKEDGLRYFRRLLTWCRTSDFLMGRTNSQNRRPFAFELAWLVNATNWTKVHEGKFNG